MKKERKNKIYGKAVSKGIVCSQDKTASANICQLYDKVEFNNGKTSIVGLDGLTMAKAIREQEVLLAKGDFSSLENMLHGQAHTLNAVFGKFIVMLSNAEQLPHLEAFGRLALKAQNQTRQTISTLAEIKGIKKTTFIHQVNNANNQQVNNGAGENLNNSANERVINHVDTASKAGGPGENQSDETLALPENTGGQGAISLECNKARHEVSKVAGVRKTTSHAGETGKRSKKYD